MAVEVTQAKSTLGLECVSIDLAGRTLESALTSAEITGYRSLLGQLIRLGQQSQIRVLVCVSGCSVTEQSDARRCQSVDQMVDQARSTAEMGFVCDLKTCSVICCADAAFANAEGAQSGRIVGLARRLELVTTGRF